MAAHAHGPRHGGGVVMALAVGALITAAIGVGWLVWSGATSTPAPARLDLDLRIPEAPGLPAPAPMPEPQPTPLPVPIAPPR